MRVSLDLKVPYITLKNTVKVTLKVTTTTVHLARGYKARKTKDNKTSSAIIKLNRTWSELYPNKNWLASCLFNIVIDKAYYTLDRLIRS